MKTNKFKKRYWLIALVPYEASGGLNDITAISDDYKKLLQHAEKELELTRTYCPYEEVYIVDTDTNKIIYDWDICNKAWKKIKSSDTQNSNPFSNYIDIL